MNQSVPPEIEEKIKSLKSQFYSKGSIVRAIKKQAGSKEKALEYISIVTNETKKEETDNPSLIKEKANRELKVGLSAFAIAIVISFFWAGGFAFLIGGFFYTLVALYHQIEYRKKINK